MQPLHRLGLLGGFAGVMIAVAPSCQNPTQLEVEIRTLAPLKCSELRGVSIVVAKGPDEAEAKLASGFITARATCRGDDTFGTLVITPSEANGAIIIAAAYGQNAECKSPYDSCILARRRFSFIDHVSLKLRVDLEASCIGTACDTLSSCKDARCVSSEVTCDASGTCALKSDAPVDAGSPSDDGGTGTLPDGAPRPVDGGGGDAGARKDGGGDGGPTNFCPLPPGPTECGSGSGQMCCGRTTTFECAAPSGCTAPSEYKLGCTGRKGCPDPTVCCYFPQSKTTICQPTCGNGLVLCSSDQDCLAGRKCTTTPAVNVVSYQVLGCEP